MQPLFVLLHAIATMSPGLEAHLRKILKRVEFKKGQFILKAGEVNTYIYFLEKGLVRIYHMHEDKEVSTWFLKEGDIFISVVSFFEQQSSVENIVALEDCICWGISFEELEEACLLYREFNTHKERIENKYYKLSEALRVKMGGKKPEEIYAWLMEEEPELLQWVPMKLLASYLNVSKRTLARVRSNYISLKKMKK